MDQAPKTSREKTANASGLDRETRRAFGINEQGIVPGYFFEQFSLVREWCLALLQKKDFNQEIYFGKNASALWRDIVNRIQIAQNYAVYMETSKGRINNKSVDSFLTREGRVIIQYLNQTIKRMKDVVKENGAVSQEDEIKKAAGLLLSVLEEGISYAKEKITKRSS